MPRDMLWRPTEPPPRKKRKPLFFIFLALVVFNAIVFVYHGDPRGRIAEVSASRGPSTQTVKTVTVPDASLPLTIEEPLDPFAGLNSPLPVQKVSETVLARGQLPAHALRDIGIDDDTIARAFASLGGHVDFRRMRPGHRFVARFDREDALVSLTVNLGVMEEYIAESVEERFETRQVEKTVETVVDHVAGSVSSSLWNAVVATGERAALIPAFVGIFAWEIDFYRDVQAGDEFEVLVEKQYVDGNFVGYGDILAARYTNLGHGHAAYMQPRADDGAPFYYDAEGQSMRKQLLKAPLKYGQITSGFGRRKHPILGYTRAHNGVDYGVPTGTPVWSVGDGRVVRAEWAGGYGRLVAIQHSNNWVSQYAHLSKILVKKGQRIRQKDVIGHVGASGLATGPHLHYELKKNGAFVNPATQRFERAKSLSGEALKKFKARVIELNRQLDQARVARNVLDPLAHEG
ncbi:MAG: peptidoglycan DD-metalloendopeptidase family protein [Myxococcota bacterium]